MTDAARMGKGVKVFDFHPIHIFLNTEDIQRYERTRLIHQDAQALLEHRCQGYGVRSRLQELMSGFKTGGVNGVAR